MLGVSMEDDLDHYHTALLKALRQHRRKFSPDPVLQSRNEKLQGRPQGKFRESPLLKNHREFFETRLLRILSRNDLDDADIQLLLPKKAQELLTKLGDLFGLLNEIASDSFEPTTCSLAPSQSLFQPRGFYPQLEKLLSLLDLSEGPFDLASGTNSSIFRINTLAGGMAASSLVRELNYILDGIQFMSQKKLPATTDTMSSSTVAADNWIQSFDHEYRAFFGRILDTICAQFAECESSGHNTPHQVMIQLLDLTISDLPISETDLDIFLYCPRPKTWQNARCKLNREVQAGSTRSKKLCEFVKSSLRREEGLVLLFDKVFAAFSRSSDAFDLPTTNPNKYPVQNLNDLITVHRVFNLPSGESEQEDLFNHPERRALAAKLALNLLIFCAWRHTSRPWDGNGVYFLSSSLKEYDRKLPYISCLVGHDSIAAFRATDDDAPIKCFTEFAKLLLEIEYGLLPSGDFSADNDHGWKIIRDFHKRKQSWGDLSRRKYLEAIDACLRFDQLFQAARNTRSGRLETLEETYRKLIRTNIVRNIVAELPAFQQRPPKRARRAPSFSENDEQVSDSDSGSAEDFEIPSTPYPTRRGLQRIFDKAKYVATVTAESDYLRDGRTLPFSTYGQGKQEVTTLGSELTPSQQPQGTRGGPKKISFQEALKINAGSLFDSQSGRQPPETAKSAQSWFNTLNNDVRPIVDCSRRTGDRVVKVAVLDTGIDSTHPRIQEHLKWNGSSIIECQDWAASPDGISDCVGHGTAVCDVLLQVAKVHLFIGKVSDSAEFDGATPARVAEAIKHAASVDGWNVDIIVLSLGFEREDDAIRQAVQDAFTKDKIILAAASNYGSIIPNKRVSYPARIQGQVLSIRSAAGQNVRSHASPKPSDGDDNFMILGEGITAAWPPDLNEDHPTRYVSGSSFATPVAAGIASLVLEFSIQRGKRGPNVPNESAGTLWTYRGIRKIFRYMSAIDDQSMNLDCSMIYPWKLFDPDGEYEGYGLEIKKLMKSA